MDKKPNPDLNALILYNKLSTILQEAKWKGVKKIMLIGIDGNEANVEKRVGVGEYSFELLKQFKEFQISNFKLQIYLKNKPRSDLPTETDWWEYKVIGPSKFWTQFALPLNLYFARPRPDVFFTPSHYAPRFSPIPTVISIMDLSYIHFPEMFKKLDLYQLRNWTAYSVRNAKKILTISKATKDDIIRVYQVPEEKVVVTYPGVKSEIRNSSFDSRSGRPEPVERAKSETNSTLRLRSGREFKMQISKVLKEKYNIDGEYILFVGTLQPRKNLLRLIEAFAKMRMDTNDYSESTRMKKNSDVLGQKIRKNSDLQLVIVGKKGWLYEEILEAPKKFGVEDKVKFLDFVPDEDLSVFYQNALCFVLPSLYEGFGLPVLEAMQYGCPVITSNVSSLPEAGGDAALYVDPENVDDIVSKIQLLIKDQKLRHEMIKKGYQQVKKFSWEKTARETLKVLEDVVKI